MIAKKRRAISRKACENCRKSHACCSDFRPCKRCETLGLTCFDTPSKKRGRKRKFVQHMSANKQAKTTSVNEQPNTSSQTSYYNNPTQQQKMITQLPSHSLSHTFPPNIYFQRMGVAQTSLFPVEKFLHSSASNNPLFPHLQIPQYGNQLMNPKQITFHQYPTNSFTSSQNTRQQQENHIVSVQSVDDVKHNLFKSFVKDQSNITENEFWTALNRLLLHYSYSKKQLETHIQQCTYMNVHGQPGPCFKHVECIKQDVQNKLLSKMKNRTCYSPVENKSSPIAVNEFNGSPSRTGLLDIKNLLCTEPEKKFSKDEVYIRNIFDECKIGIIIYLYDDGTVITWNKTARVCRIIFLNIGVGVVRLSRC